MRELTSDTAIRLDRIKGLKEWRETLAMDKEDRNGMEHSDTNGQFVSKDNHEGKKGVAAKLRDEFTEKTSKYLNTDFANKKTGIAARFTQNSQNEIKSHVQNSKSNGFSIQEHFECANQIKELFENATLEREHEDTKHGHKDLRIERFLSEKVKLSSGKTARVCITVKHSLDKNGRTLYSIEAMDIKNALEKTRAKGQPKDSVSPRFRIIPQMPQEVKENLTNDGRSLYGLWKLAKGVA